MPRYAVIDKGKPFVNKLMSSLCEQFKFSQHKSSMYTGPANGLVEPFNKTLYNLLKMMVSKSKQDWHENLGEVLWAYRTSSKMQSTLYALVCGVEAVLPL